MDALDGNAIAGQLFEHFGTEMTTAWGSSAHCAATAQVAELRVYMRAPVSYLAKGRFDLPTGLMGAKDGPLS